MQHAVFKDKMNGPKVISTLFDVQLGASTVVTRVSVMSGNLTEQLDKCKWFSIQCDESMDSSSSLQLMMFIQMVFEELLTQLPLKTTTREADIYNTVKRFFVEEKRDHWKRCVDDNRPGSPRDGLTCRRHCTMQRVHRVPKISTFPLHDSPAGDVQK